MTSTAPPIALHPDWVENPLVRYALDSLPPGVEVLTVLEKLHEMMCTLEATTPGIPFREITEAWSEDSADRGRRAAVGLLSAAGASRTTIQELVAGDRPAAMSNYGFKYRSHPGYDDMVESRRNNVPVQVLADRHNVSPSFVYRVLELDKHGTYGQLVPYRRKRTTPVEDHPLFRELRDAFTAGRSEGHWSPRTVQERMGVSVRTAEKVLSWMFEHRELAP
jgi:hypothetical protein